MSIYQTTPHEFILAKWRELSKNGFAQYKIEIVQIVNGKEIVYPSDLYGEDEFIEGEDGIVDSNLYYLHRWDIGRVPKEDGKKVRLKFEYVLRKEACDDSYKINFYCIVM